MSGGKERNLKEPLFNYIGFTVAQTHSLPSFGLWVGLCDLAMCLQIGWGVFSHCAICAINVQLFHCLLLGWWRNWRNY